VSQETRTEVSKIALAHPIGSRRVGQCLWSAITADLKTKGLALRMDNFALTAFIKFRGPQALNDNLPTATAAQVIFSFLTDVGVFTLSASDQELSS